MRAIWSQAARPRICANTAPREASHAILNRGTTTVRLRRRLKFSDAFTIFLAPFLTTAFLADTSWKEKKKRDWDRKIAEINEEIEFIRAREAETWTRLQFRSIKLGLAHQRRQYSTSAREALADADDERDWREQDSDLEEAWTPYDPIPEGTSFDPDLIKELFELDTRQELELQDETILEVNEDDPDMQTWRHLERMVMVKVALRMILHAQAGRRFVLDGLPERLAVEIEEFGLPEDATAVARRLRVLNHRIAHFKVPLEPSGIYKHAWMTPGKRELHEEVSKLVDHLEEGNVNIPTFIAAFVRIVVQATHTLSLSTYLKMLAAFSRLKLHEWSRVVVIAIHRTRQPIDDRAVTSIMLHHGARFDQKFFNAFINLLTATNSGGWNVKDKWEWWRINDCRVPVPASQHPRLLQVLIYAALRTNQIQRAEAWTTILKDQDYGKGSKAHLFKSFLNYCAYHVDWNRGRRWIVTSIEWVVATVRESVQPASDLSRLVLRILDLCVACGRQEDYDRILKAAVAAGIHQPIKNVSSTLEFSHRCKAILDEWADLNQQREKKFKPSDEEMAMEFQTLLQPFYLVAQQPQFRLQADELSADQINRPRVLSGNLQLEDQSVNNPYDDNKITMIDKLQQELAQSRDLVTNLVLVQQRLQAQIEKNHIRTREMVKSLIARQTKLETRLEEQTAPVVQQATSTQERTFQADKHTAFINEESNTDNERIHSEPDQENTIQHDLPSEMPMSVGNHEESHDGTDLQYVVRHELSSELPTSVENQQSSQTTFDQDADPQRSVREHVEELQSAQSAPLHNSGERLNSSFTRIAFKQRNYPSVRRVQPDKIEPIRGYEPIRGIKRIRPDDISEHVEGTSFINAPQGFNFIRHQ